MDEQKIYHAALEAAYADKALEDIRTALTGNGIDPEKIMLEVFKGETAEFIATTKLVLMPQTIEKRTPGQLKGPVKADSPKALRELIEKETQKCTSAPDTIRRIKDVILERDDKGLNLKDEIIKLPFLQAEFVVFEHCGPCRGKGKIHCKHCHGKGYAQCTLCYGDGFQPCVVCNGQGQIAGQSGQYQSCTRCNGQRKTPCSRCQQKGRARCTVCKTKGATRCKHCNGHAWISLLTRLEIAARANFEYPREELAENISAQIDALGPALKDHILFTPIIIETEEQQDPITISYKMILPHASVQFTAGETIIPALVFGIHSLLSSTTGFLQIPLKRGMERLKFAAQGQGDVADHMHAAAQYKTLRMAINAAVKHPQKKVASILLKNTPHGLNKKLALDIAGDAVGAIKKITRQPRQIGIACGFLLVGAFGALYGLSPARSSLLSHIDNKALHIGADLAIAVLICAVGYVAATAWEKTALKQVLDKISKPEKNGRS